MTALLRRRSDTFEAVLSSLRVDGSIAAARLDVRSGPVVHDLVNAYDDELQPYMPGHLLRGEALRTLADEGVRELHFGSGDYAWKRELANASVPFVSGVVHADSAQGRFNAAAFRLGRRWSALPLGPAARAPHGLSWRLERGLSRLAPPP
jgi:CelD/BcsL family acetyltransferase involved in cellulose biosynthesis